MTLEFLTSHGKTNKISIHKCMNLLYCLQVDRCLRCFQGKTAGVPCGCKMILRGPAMNIQLCLNHRKWNYCLGMVFCYQNCSDLLWEKIVLVIEKNFEIAWTIYSNSERSEQFLVTECFFNLFLEISQQQKYSEDSTGPCNK